MDRILGALGGDRLGDVVVVEQADIDLAVGDRVANRDVVRVVDGVVGDHALDPVTGDFVAVLEAQRGTYCCSESVTGAQPTRPRQGVGELERRVGKLERSVSSP